MAVQAQQTTGRLNIQLNKNILQPGDSLMVAVDFNSGVGHTPNNSLATLEVLIEDELGRRTRLRWPMINGHAAGSLYLPDSLHRGRYILAAGLQDRFFEVKGKLMDRKMPDSIQAMLLTKSGDWAQQSVAVTNAGAFTIRNWLFEDNGILAFSSVNNNSQPLNISISTQLDSGYNFLAVTARSFYVGNPSPTVKATLNQTEEVSQGIFEVKGAVLPAVVVRTTPKNKADKFNAEFVSGLFHSANERIINVFEDPASISFPNIFSYLQGRVAGLQITPAGFGGGAARWRGGPVTFFLDEIRVSPQLIANIPMTDIAIVKAYPPPFIGSPGGGGAVAIYTRRGGLDEYLPPNSQVFKVRGYTPAAIALDMNKFHL